MDFQKANLQGAKFENVKFEYVILRGADIRGADFSSSQFSSLFRSDSKAGLFRDAIYDRKTKFPEGFDPLNRE